MVIFNHSKINCIFVVIPIIIIILYLWYHTGHNYNNNFGVVAYGPKIYHKLFYFFTFILIFFTLCIFTHIQFYALMSDYFLDIHGIKIQIIYTTDEKKAYFWHLYHYMVNILKIENYSYFQNFFENIFIEKELDITFAEIRTFSVDLIKATVFLDELHHSIMKIILMEEHSEQCVKILQEKYWFMQSIKNIIISSVLINSLPILLTPIGYIILMPVHDILLKPAMCVIIDISYSLTREILSKTDAKRVALIFLRKLGPEAFYNSIRNYLPHDISID